MHCNCLKPVDHISGTMPGSKQTSPWGVRINREKVQSLQTKRTNTYNILLFIINEIAYPCIIAGHQLKTNFTEFHLCR